MYTPKIQRQAADLRTSYADLQLHSRLMTVLQERLGHRMASAVEQAKIAASQGLERAEVDLSAIEANLRAQISADAMALHLAALLGEVVQCAHECVRKARIQPGDLGAIYLTGGSSALRPFQRALAASFPGTTLVEGDLFGGVANGLAYAAARPAAKT